MRRLIRIDDFPNGDKAMHQEWLKGERKPHYRRIKPILDILNRNGSNYILGVSPLLIDNEDIDFLNENIQSGRVVIHGFDHAWNFKEWSKITSIWEAGGEFSLLSKEQIESLYLQSLNIFSKLKMVDLHHFIPPFNCYNKDLLDILNKYNVKYIHGCDKEQINYKLDRFNYGSISSVISEWAKTYSDVDVVLRNLKNPSQITLHWIYDLNRHNYLSNYEKISQL